MFATDARGAIRGFIATNVCRVTLDETPIQLACTSHLAVESASRGTAAGAFLLRATLQGRQDATFADAAGPAVRGVWKWLRGRCEPLRSLRWMQLLQPGQWLMRTGLAAARRRHPRSLFPVPAAPLRPLVPAAVAPRRCGKRAPAERLDVETFLERIDRVALAGVRVRYDGEYVAWLLSRAAGGAERERPHAAGRGEWW
jgi:hypothetical protein